MTRNRNIELISSNVCFVTGKKRNYYIKSPTGNPNGVTGYGDTRSEARSYEFLRRTLCLPSGEIRVPFTHMIGDKLIVSAAPETQIASYAETVISSRSDSFLIEIFIKKFFRAVLSTSLDVSADYTRVYIERIISQLHERISLFRSNQGNIDESLLRSLEYHGDILIQKLNDLLDSSQGDRVMRLVVSHGDLNPENIFVNPECGTVYLIDPRDSNYRDVAYDLNTFLGYFFVFCGATRISGAPVGLQVINPRGYEISLVMDFLLTELRQEEILLLEVYLYLNFSRIILGMYNSRKRYIPTEHGENLARLACVVAEQGLVGLRNSMQMKES